MSEPNHAGSAAQNGSTSGPTVPGPPAQDYVIPDTDLAKIQLAFERRRRTQAELALAQQAAAQSAQAWADVERKLVADATEGDQYIPEAVDIDNGVVKRRFKDAQGPKRRSRLGQ